MPNRHDRGRDGTRVNTADAGGNRKQQDARRGTAGNQPEDITQQTERVWRRASRRGVNRDHAAGASYQADAGDDGIGVSGGGSFVGGVRVAADEPGDSRNKYAGKQAGERPASNSPEDRHAYVKRAFQTSEGLLAALQSPLGSNPWIYDVSIVDHNGQVLVSSDTKLAGTIAQGRPPFAQIDRSNFFRQMKIL